MSNDAVYQILGVPGYEVLSSERDRESGGVRLTLERRPRALRCSACGSKEVDPHGQVTRPFTSIPIGRKPVEVVAGIPRVECKSCGLRRQVRVGFADPRVSYTRAFARYALDLSRHMTMQDVADHLQVSWGIIKQIQRQALQREFGRPKLKHVRRIAIDEISIAKGHRYVTVVLDLDSGAVLFVGDGKGAEALQPFWPRLRASHAKVEAVAMDMSRAYIAAVQTHLPRAVIVFDHFHVIKLYNEKLSDLRRDLYREATERMHKEVLKGIRWLLLKNPDKLDDKKKEKARLDAALELNEPLYLAYYMKEQLRRIWDYPDKESARRQLQGWIELAEMSGLRMLTNFAKTLREHREGILNYYTYRISTGPLEGTNNKIKTMKRQAYGFRDHEFFKLKILGIHKTRYALVG